ncbi:MAG: TonB-dependent receptor [Thermoflavifilum sp.]|nr:TonB-dependent receptor [Thermoflavifilum sp.]
MHRLNLHNAWYYGLFFICLVASRAMAQIQQSSSAADTLSRSHQLQEVVIQAFEEKQPWLQQPVPLAILSNTRLHAFAANSPLPALNTLPGIRMEQRSPSSYRLNIRGSSIRAPFGVREVKIYYNGIPLTGPGGDTYLNQLAFSDYGAIEVIKGPAASVYGAGIGGVMLIQSPLQTDADSSAAAYIQGETGSYQTHHLTAQGFWGSAAHRQYASYSFFRSAGYRDHTHSWQHTANYESIWHTRNHQQADLWLHYTHLFYQTPGGLTAAEMQKNPRMARPASGPYPSADSAHAAIDQQNFIAGFHFTQQLGSGLDNRTAVYLAYTDLFNPTFRNVEYRKEPHAGLRTVMQYTRNLSHTQLVATLGTEWQQGFFSIEDYGNKQGQPDTLQTHYQENLVQGLVFAQVDIHLPSGWNLVAGLSLQQSSLSFHRFYPEPFTVWNVDFHSNWSPRVAVLKTFPGSRMSVYANISKGFSPPTLSELLPSTNILNPDLKPESGYNYELGWKGYALRQRLSWELNAYQFNLQQSISQQRDSSGADYFINAGKTRQRGLEAYLSYILMPEQTSQSFSTQLFTSLSLTDYRYQGYAPLGHDYTGKHIPGVSPFTWVSGVYVQWEKYASAFLNWNHTQAIPLNDANSAYGRSYDVIDLKIQHQWAWGDKYGLTIYAGVNNLLNRLYSLGDDVNAAGGRYYNPAPARNYYAGLRWGWRP